MSQVRTWNLKYTNKHQTYHVKTLEISSRPYLVYVGVAKNRVLYAKNVFAIDNINWGSSERFWSPEYHEIIIIS